MPGNISSLRCSALIIKRIRNPLDVKEEIWPQCQSSSDFHFLFKSNGGFFTQNSCYFYLFIIFAELRFEPRAYTLSHSTSPFCDGFFFKVGYQELFAWGWLGATILLISAS
jgi:hypothetical protein